MKFTYLLALLLLASCGNTNETEMQQPADASAVEQDSLPQPSNDISGCYLYTLDRDTLIAKLQQNGDRVEGSLVFDNYRMDGSRGTVNGEMVGDIIKLQYVFTSEGMNSVMDVYFKVENGAIVRGMGDVDVKGDTAYFKDPSLVTYPTSTVLKKIDCEELE